MPVEGVRIGLDSVYYALLTSDASGGAVYETPVALEGAIELNINPNSVLETLFADDGPMVVAASLGDIEVAFTIADALPSQQAILLGHTASGGVVKRLANATPPWLALGFRALKSSGNYLYAWLLKGKFREPELNHATRADSINFQTIVMNANFVKREFDDAWIKQTDADDTGFVQATADSWFTDGPDES